MKSLPQSYPRLAASLGVLACLGLTASAQTLQHRYSFNDPAGNPTFADSVGGVAWTGTNMGTAYLDGTSLTLDGFGSFGQVPADIIGTNSSLTVEFWASFSEFNPVWTRVFSIGSQNLEGNKATGLDYCHFAGGDWQNLSLDVPGKGVYANNPGGLNGRTNVHVTVIVDPASNIMLYYNGSAVRSNPGVNGGTVPALSGIEDALTLIGKSLFDVDATLAGAIDEFRVYGGVLSRGQVVLNDAAGPDNYFSDPGPLLAVHLSSPDNPLLVNQVSQQAFTGDFQKVTGVDLPAYGGATFTSGDEAVLTIDANGLVRAMGQGTTTIIASFGGLSATNTVTVLAIPAQLQHRYSFDSNANDSAGNASGTLQGTAVVAGGKAVLDGQVGSYVELPADKINIATNKAVTIDVWADFGETPPWSRLFNFGADGGSSEIYFAPRGPGNGEMHRLSQNIGGGQTIDWIGALSNASAHITCVIDPPSSTLAIYRDGVLEYARYDANASLSLVSTNLAVIGRSLVGADAYMPGAIDEFRIYSGALTPQEVAVVHKNGVGSTSKDPGALQSIEVVATAYPAFSQRTPPVLLANYANLSGFNLVPNNCMFVNGLTVTSSDTNVIQVLANNMLRTLRPGKATLTASYQGQTDSTEVTVQNIATLTHRYPFTTDASDVVGTAHGTYQGAAAVANGSLVLDGSQDTYLELPPGLLAGYDGVTVDTWVTFNTASTWSRLWYFGDDRANEYYLAPSVLDGNSHWYSAGIANGDTITLSPRWENQTLHITCVFGNGTMEYYTNGVLHGRVEVTNGRVDEIGKRFSWIGRSPHPDPFMNCTVNEFRIYRGRLSAEEILASDVIGPDQTLSTSPAPMSVARQTGNVQLLWPVAAGGFSVQARASLGSGEWTTLTNAPLLSGNQWQMTISTTNGPRFFRLWR
jgi:hypothetical protein